MIERDLFGRDAPVEPTLEEAPVPALAEPEALVPDQAALFDMATLTRPVPGADVKAALTAAGLTPEAGKKVFDEASIRQIVTYWQADHYVAILEKLAAAGKYFGTDNHTDTLEHLLDYFTRQQLGDRGLGSNGGVPVVAGPCPGPHEG